jgi:hypothetical protein
MPLDERMLSRFERELLDRASDWPDPINLAELTVDELRAVAEREGIDFATALLYQRVCASEQHGPFIQAIDELLDDTGPIGDAPYKLAIVPGAFYQEFPASGADGRLVREAARPLEIDVEVIPVKSFGSIKSNAEIIVNWLQEHDRGPTVLVSLSKGGSDIKQALDRPGAGQAFRDVVAWVNLSGILYGTPLVSWVLRWKLRTWWYRCLLGVRGYDFDVVRQLDCTADSPLHKTLTLPAGMRAIHVVGFPLRDHLTNSLARRWYRRIRHCGPNDGAGILLGNLTRTPGQVYPLWGADHYLRPRGRDPIQIARAILRYLAQTMETAECDNATNTIPPSLERCR